MSSTRLPVAEAIVRFLAAQRVGPSGERACGGVFAIFGHGNVAGLGKALARGELPVFRGNNEQGMALAATAFAKASRRRRFMACTTSIGPGATNLVTAAAVARVNRLPLLLLPGDAFATRRVDPALQQLEVGAEPGVTVNDCLRPVSAYFDRIQRPEQLVPALEQAIRVLFDPVATGPVTLCLPQDVQAEMVEVAQSFFEPRVWTVRRPPPDAAELTRAADDVRRARRVALVAGGGVRYSGAEAELSSFATSTGMPVVETPAGRGVSGPRGLGGVGVAGTAHANRAVDEADLVLAVGTRLSDFTTGSRVLLRDKPIVHLNIDSRDACKLDARPLVADAALGLAGLHEALNGFEIDADWGRAIEAAAERWWADLEAEPEGDLPSDGQVIDAVARWARASTTVVAASGSIPGELQKRWRNRHPDDVHLEYGYSCMGYEIAGALGTKLARPETEVVALVGDGAYLMLSSELQTSVALGQKIVVVVFDNAGFGCIHRLQRRVGSPPLANLRAQRDVDFAANARSLGCHAEAVSGVAELDAALDRARGASSTYVIVIPTDPDRETQAGGAWWDVPSWTDAEGRGNGA
jgi:3D-(3,5/4)-trihydroxycyclohexane-1,2-dione acylhydrolase (decyclizing)